MPSNHSKGEDNEEALKPEDDVVEEVHLSLKNISIKTLINNFRIRVINLETPNKLKSCQQDGDRHHTAKDEPALFSGG